MAEKITELSQVSSILRRMLELMESDSKEDEREEKPEEEPKEESDKEESGDTEKSEDVIGFTAETEMLSKSLDEERVAYSIAYPVMPEGWKDHQNDFITEPEVRNMAHTWMENSTRYDIQHKILNVAKEDAVVVESFLAPVDIDWPIGNNTFKRINKGSWVVATKFSEKLWEDVRKGNLNAYSIRGKAKRIRKI